MHLHACFFEKRVHAFVDGSLNAAIAGGINTSAGILETKALASHLDVLGVSHIERVLVWGVGHVPVYTVTHWVELILRAGWSLSADSCRGAEYLLNVKY